MLTAAVVLGFGIWLLRRRQTLSIGEAVLVAATATLVVPLLQMHERYFYLAEMLLVGACFVDRRFLLPARAIEVASVSTSLATSGAAS